MIPEKKPSLFRVARNFLMFAYYRIQFLLIYSVLFQFFFIFTMNILVQVSYGFFNPTFCMEAGEITPQSSTVAPNIGANPSSPLSNEKDILEIFPKMYKVIQILPNGQSVFVEKFQFQEKLWGFNTFVDGGSFVPEGWFPYRGWRPPTSEWQFPEYWSHFYGYQLPEEGLGPEGWSPPEGWSHPEGSIGIGQERAIP